MEETRRWSGMIGFALIGLVINWTFDPFLGGLVAGTGVSVVNLMPFPQDRNA